MSGARLAATAIALAWLLVGIVLALDIGHLPARAVNRMRAIKVERSAVTPFYWRAWGGVLAAAGLALLIYSASI